MDFVFVISEFIVSYFTNFFKYTYSRGMISHKLSSSSCRALYSSIRLCSTAQSQPKFFDVVISGGGICGSTLAATLKTNPATEKLSILVLSRTKFEPSADKGVWSPRTVAMNKQGAKILSKVFSEDEISTLRRKNVHRMQVWEATSNSSITFREPKKPLCSIVDVDQLHQLFLGKLKQVSGIESMVANDMDINYFEENSQRTVLDIQLASGETVQTKLLVGCEGRDSSVARILNEEVPVKYDYEQKAIITNLTVDPPDEQNFGAWQRMLPTGPIALLPITENASSLIWSCDEAKADELLQLSDDDFLHAINNAFSSLEHQKVSAVPYSDTFCEPPYVSGLLTKRFSFPLGLTFSRKFVGPRTIVIGDAAHTVHPMAGLGLNIGFDEVTSLTKRLGQICNIGGDVGEEQMLCDLQTQNRLKSGSVAATTHLLHTLYSPHALPHLKSLPGFHLASAIGMSLVDSIPPLKNLIVNAANFKRPPFL